MLLKDDGSVWATGWNRFGQLGDGTYMHRKRFVQVVANGVRTAAQAGSRHSLILKQDNSVWVITMHRGLKHMV